MIMDAWIREAEEASQRVEDLESRVTVYQNSFNLNSESQQETSVSVNVVDSARSKILELGVKLDRLESLLRNPPTKPILTDEDMDFRWKMFSDIQLRTRTLARSLYLLPCPIRPRNVPATGGQEYNVSTDCDCDDQAVDLMETSYSQDQSELLEPLMADDADRSQVQLWKACSTIFLFLGLAALLFLVVLLCTVI